jgi:uncharacterized lipoprotein YajG
MRRALVLLGLLLAAGGCASASGLDVGYPASGINRAMLASAPSRSVTIGPVTDRRRETRIGIEPESKKDIVTRRPVTEIVRDALAAELGANGHTLAAHRADVVMAVDVEEFRLDTVKGYAATQYVGKVVIALVVSDPTGRRVLERRYVGINRRQADADSESAPREVMDTALARVMHDLATDSDLVRALARVPTAFAR